MTVTLYCFPYSGGGASFYQSWSADLTIETQVRAYQLPGREERFNEYPHESFDALMEQLYETLLPTISPPYALFGHSMGALIAFELARQMRKRGRPLPIRLLISGINAPQTLDFTPPFTHQKSDEELLLHLKRLGGTPEFFEDVEIQKLFLPLIRADFKVAESYRYSKEPPLACPISVWGGADDILTSLDELELWREQTTADFRLRILPGKHQFVSTAKRELLAGINKDLLESLEEAMG